jgi:hypothetical protein
MIQGAALSLCTYCIMLFMIWICKEEIMNMISVTPAICTCHVRSGITIKPE